MSNSPNRTHGTGSRTGGIAGDADRSSEMGTVLSAQTDRYTHSVRTERGVTLHGVPRKKSSPSDITVLPVGTSVILRYDLPLPYIDGCLDLPAIPSSTSGVPVGGPADTLEASTQFSVGSYRGPYEPSDMQAGDHLLANISGARVGVLGGGVAVLSASQFSQIRAHLLDDLVEVFSRNYRHITGMGIFKIQNNEGKVNMSFRGASDQTNEAATDEENWTIKMDLGSEGDLFNFQLTTPAGQDLFKMHVDSNGRCEIFGLDGVVLQSGNRNGQPHIEEHGGDATCITRGNATSQILGNETVVVGGSHTASVDGTATVSVGSDIAAQAVRDIGLSAGRNMRVAAAGDLTGGVALQVEARGGDYETQVGLPTFPTPKYTVKTFKGDIDFESTLAGNINFKSLLGEQKSTVRKFTVVTQSPDSVILGGTNLVSHVAKYEQLESLVRALLQMLALHVHPTSSPGAPTGPSPTPFPAIANLLLPIKSLKVGVSS